MSSWFGFAKALFSNTDGDSNDNGNNNKKKIGRSVSERGNNALMQIKEKLQKLQGDLANKERDLQLLNDELAEEREKNTEMAASLEKLRELYEENRTSLLQREREVIQYKKATAQHSMETGIYSLGEIDPSKVSDNWHSIYMDLHHSLVETLDRQSSNLANSTATERYRKLTYHHMQTNFSSTSTYSRHQAYVLVQEMSSLFCKISRQVVVNKDGTLEYNEGDDLVDSLMKYVMATSNRQDFSKCVLSFLAPPNNIDATSPLIFEKLPGGLKIFLEEKFKDVLGCFHKVATTYDISAEVVDSALKTVIYKAIYTMFQMTTIGNNFVSFWSNSTWDFKILNLSHDGDMFAHYTETFNNKLETVELSFGPNDNDPHILFTVFPGCLYTNGSGEIKVIARSQVVCSKYAQSTSTVLENETHSFGS